ncbi:hypothetical protein KUL17_09370 [Alteromonas sp. KUL17]|uniref:hypothetical protein n=1 Tax=Alteromonas sp. KUL17 TaxID=2480796 RepID=UPI0010375B09|nr:hypothetical protein [Alteromonas sp. KUL17]TAP30302.1 hypothetical protein KUL49_04690 [Alteromonas sp. KUL17]GEA02040.1 hypothetical protein KUL17_09370 [Alteromonas sp. KUL17]
MSQSGVEKHVGSGMSKLLGAKRIDALNKSTIVPEKINKPIQLLGAWLAGLFSVDSCFLFAASRMESGSTESVALVIAAIANVPLFLIAVFLLQTRFRPELQEDSYYSTYLSQKTNEPISIKKEDGKLAELSQKIATLEVLVSSQKQPTSSQELLAGILFGVNEFLPYREEIKALLRQKGVLGVSSFGNKDLPRPKFAVAISEYLPKQVQNHVIEIAKELGATHYSFFDNHKEETEEEVLFGGYNADQFEIA